MFLAMGCTAEIDNPAPNVPLAIPEGSTDEAATSTIRRLSIHEYRRSVQTLVGIDPESARELLPEDPRTPFDNDLEHQRASEALVGGFELLAGDLADAVVGSDTLFANVMPCEPTGVMDRVCFDAFLRDFGAKALRRPLSDEDVSRFSTLLQHAAAAADFRQAVNAALRVFLQHPEFLYRIEIGEPIPDRPGVVALTGSEIAARLSFFLLGQTPPDWLLTAAQEGQLDTADDVESAAVRLLDDPRTLGRIARFHGMLLGYERLSDAGIFGDMHAETEALIGRVVFEENLPWTQLLLSEETFVTPALAEHYGLDVPDEPAWVSYGGSGRRGLFSHGTFLSAVPKFGDTSPTQRGLLIRAQLFCRPIPLPSADLMVNVDEPPAVEDPNACKSDTYYMSRDPRCAGCHTQMDLIGFGLENYDQTGRYRETENGRDDCEISGEGEFIGLGGFRGPAELAELAVETGLVDSCVARQLYRFAHGRNELDENDEAFLRRADEMAAENGFRVTDYIRLLVRSDAFRTRRIEETP